MSRIEQMVEKIRDDDKFQELFQHLSEKLNYKEGLDELLLTVIREFLEGPEMEPLLLQQATVSNVTQLWISFYERLLHSDMAFHIGSCGWDPKTFPPGLDLRTLGESGFKMSLTTWRENMSKAEANPDVPFSAGFKEAFFARFALTTEQAQEKTVGELIEHAPVLVLLGLIRGKK